VYAALALFFWVVFFMLCPEGSRKKSSRALGGDRDTAGFGVEGDSNEVMHKKTK
jgi:hypothetical protein